MILTYKFHDNQSIVLLDDDVVELVKTEAFVWFSVVDDMSVMHHFDKFVIVEGLA